MKEVLDQWNFVIATYVLGIAGTLALVAWSWLSMKRAERKRDKTRGK
jgi:hypothetical protein